jgi:hypothetical protein
VKTKLASIKKELAYLAAMAGVALSLGVIPAPEDKYVASAVAILGFFGIKATSNLLTQEQLLAQPGYAPQAYPPMPLTEDNQHAAAAEAPAPHPRDSQGRFTKKGTT